MSDAFDPWSVLTPAQAEVARRWLAERERDRRHLVIYLSGAHAYGFPSPDSDLDLKCVHIAPTAELVGLSPPDDPPDRIEIVDGVELDYGSNELAGVLRGALKGNGNYLERLLGDLVLGGDRALLEEARAVVRPLLSRRSARHYGGFATSQLRAFDEKPSAKRALYVLRTAATGRHLLAHGEIVTDVARLQPFLPAELPELLEMKRRGERQELPAERAAAWRGLLTAAIAAVDASVAASVLPPEPPEPAARALEAWLRDVRRRCW
ncbi:MAG TPA: nucleotidyltransferase domain-containing protein [Kofleriaceae bacterium]|nr:nucleotidyltransferase domain-containing protein [Kofleriaceae bacterium]